LQWGVLEEGLHALQKMAAAAVAAVQDVINNTDDTTSVGEALFSIATELVNEFNGQVPATKAGLEKAKAEGIVAALVMQCTFGSTELVIGLNTRKVMVVLDLFDWEESGANELGEVKMSNVSAAQIKHSLDSWIPKGERRTFQDTMEALGAVIGGNKVGSWGKSNKRVSNRFSPEDKKALLNMTTSISQFCKSVKSGGKGRRKGSQFLCAASLQKRCQTNR